MKKICFIGFFLFIALFEITNVKAVSIENSDINLYHLSEDYSHLEMPSEFKDEEKIIVKDANGNMSFRLIEGEDVSVSTNGVVKMEPEIWRCKGFCQSWEPEDKTGYTKRISYYERDSKIEVRVGNEKFVVNVHTHLYEKTYAEEKMKKYVDEHITQNMTELEKMQEIMDFISMTKYSYNSSSYIGLVAGDGADCWGASALKNIEIPNGMKMVGEKAFVNTSLKEVIIPASVTEIGNGAFSNVELIVEARNVTLGQGLCNASYPIHGYKGSTVETYAQENNCPFIEISVEDYMKGDFDQNGIVQMNDIITALRLSLNIETEEKLLIGDIDEDGEIKMNDVIFILKTSLNLV